MQVFINGTILNVIISCANPTAAVEGRWWRWSVQIAGAWKKGLDLNNASSWSGRLYNNPAGAFSGAADALQTCIGKHPSCQSGVRSLPMLPSAMDPA